MQTPRIFIAFAPRGGGLTCAVACIPAGDDVIGWYLGRTEGGIMDSAYFLLENYYSRGPLRFASAPEGALHSDWIEDDAAHALAALQEAFVNEWLFYADEIGAELQLAAYAQRGLHAGDMNVRVDKLNRFAQGQASWVYYSREFEHGVLEALSKRWSLDFRAVPA